MPKFVIYGLDFEPAYELFSEIHDDDNVQIIRQPTKIFSKSFLKVLRHSIFKKKLSRNLLKRVFVFPDFDTSEEIVFIYMNPWVKTMGDTGYVNYLRERYPSSYHVVSFLDIHQARKLDLPDIKTKYDQLFIYDKKEASVMGINYLPAMYSKKDYDYDAKQEKYDISFIGQAKERYPEILRVYKTLTSKGLKCRFYIVGVPKADRYFGEGIEYGDIFLTPKESFEYTACSKCLLEIQLHETDALTSRIREAIVYDKKILTNNPSIKKYPYYNNDMVQIYSNAEDIDTGFFNKPNFSYNYKGEFSPKAFLDSVYSICVKH